MDQTCHRVPAPCSRVTPVVQHLTIIIIAGLHGRSGAPSLTSVWHISLDGGMQLGRRS